MKHFTTKLLISMFIMSLVFAVPVFAKTDEEKAYEKAEAEYQEALAKEEERKNALADEEIRKHEAEIVKGVAEAEEAQRLADAEYSLKEKEAAYDKYREYHRGSLKKNDYEKEKKKLKDEYKDAQKAYKQAVKEYDKALKTAEDAREDVQESWDNIADLQFQRDVLYQQIKEAEYWMNYFK